MTCTLCGLDSGNASFCCAGCENVHAILVESGVIASGRDFRETELYQQSLKLGLISKPASAPPDIPANAETREAVFQLSGMWCTSCGWLIEHALTRTRGVRSAEVAFASDLLRVRYCPQYAPPDRILERVRSLGYRVSQYAGPGGPSDAERQDLLLRLARRTFRIVRQNLFWAFAYNTVGLAQPHPGGRRHGAFERVGYRQLTPAGVASARGAPSTIA
jgi:copper chaperone CopZ